MISDRPEYEEDAFGYESERYSELATFAEPTHKCAALDCSADCMEDWDYCLLHQIEADRSEIELKLHMETVPSAKGWWKTNKFKATKKGMEA